MEQPSKIPADVTTTPAAQELGSLTPPDAYSTTVFDDPTADDSTLPKLGLAGGAALGGGALLLVARRRARRRRETRRRQMEATAKAAGARAKGAATRARHTAVKAKDVASGTAVKAKDAAANLKGVAAAAGSAASTAGSKVRTGVDRMADDRRMQVYAITGAGVAWLYLKLAEVRQLRKLSRSVATAR